MSQDMADVFKATEKNFLKKISTTYKIGIYNNVLKIRTQNTKENINSLSTFFSN